MERDLTSHFQSVHEEKHFQHCCHICCTEFLTKCELNMHIKLHRKCFGCSKCTKLFLTERDRTAHYQSIHTEKPFLCWRCDKTFIFQVSNYKQLAGQHEEQHEKEDGRHFHQCSLCEQVFLHMGSLLYHRRIHPPDGKPAYCPCGIRFLDYLRFNRHIAFLQCPRICTRCAQSLKSECEINKHGGVVCCKKLNDNQVAPSERNPDVNAINAEQTKEPEEFACTFCGKQFKDNWKFLKHSKKLKFPLYVYPCKVCGIEFDSKKLRAKHQPDGICTTILSHKRVQHSAKRQKLQGARRKPQKKAQCASEDGDIVVKTIKKELVCCVCKVEFISDAALNSHTCLRRSARLCSTKSGASQGPTHTDEQLSTPQCSMHHFAVNPVLCICGKAFQDTLALNRHTSVCQKKLSKPNLPVLHDVEQNNPTVITSEVKVELSAVKEELHDG